MTFVKSIATACGFCTLFMSGMALADQDTSAVPMVWLGDPFLSGIEKIEDQPNAIQTATEISTPATAELFTFAETAIEPDLELGVGMEISNVPVPASLLLLGTALGALGIARSRHGRR